MINVNKKLVKEWYACGGSKMVKEKLNCSLPTALNIIRKCGLKVNSPGRPKKYFVL